MVLTGRKEDLSQQKTHALTKKEVRDLKAMKNQDSENKVTLMVQEDLKNQKVIKEEMITLKVMKNQGDLTNLLMMIQERDVHTIEKSEVQENMKNRIERKTTIKNIVRKEKKQQNSYQMDRFV